MKILAWAASNSRNSINKSLVTAAATLFAEKILPTAEIEILDINDYEMPLYSIDRETESGIPELAHQFYNKIGEADAILVSFAEHNGSLTAAYKNLFDWASRIDGKVYQNKPAVYLSTSPGQGGAASVLALSVASAPHFAADLKGHLSIRKFNENFDREKGELNNPELSAQLESILEKLA